MRKRNFFISLIGIFICIFVVGGVIFAGGPETKDATVVSNYYGAVSQDITIDGCNTCQEAGLGAVEAIGGICDGSEPTTQLCNVNVYELGIQTDLSVTGEVTMKEATTAIAPTSIYATTTISVADSGTTYYLSAKGNTITLPAVTDGVNLRFVINGAADTGNFIIDSAEGDNIEGTLLVAGAVVDCDAEDQINFVVDGENIGDYVELRSDGTQWLIGDSGALTAGKLTCSNPS